MQQWDYYEEQFGVNDPTESRLQELGRLGWELAAITDFGSVLRYTFKKPTTDRVTNG